MIGKLWLGDLIIRSLYLSVSIPANEAVTQVQRRVTNIILQQSLEEPGALTYQLQHHQNEFLARATSLSNPISM